jgi:hypothetical protein
MTLIIMRQKYKGKKMLILYTPQPDHVVTLHRYYTTLKREKSYKKHVSWLNIKFLKKLTYSYESMFEMNKKKIQIINVISL